MIISRNKILESKARELEAFALGENLLKPGEHIQVSICIFRIPPEPIVTVTFEPPSEAPLTEEEWRRILKVRMSPLLQGVLKAFHKAGEKAILPGKIEGCLYSRIAQINRILRQNDLPYKIATSVSDKYERGEGWWARPLKMQRII